MPQFNVNAHRFDPYKNFKFQVYVDNRLVLGVSKMGALSRTTEVVNYRSGGGNTFEFKSPGRTKYDSITLERGVTHDPEFEMWASQVHGQEGSSVTDLRNYKKDMIVNVMNLRNQVALSYKIYKAWPSKYQAMSDLDAGQNGVLIENLTLEIEWWQRDPDVGEPDESA
ncbi:MAG: phage tail protein [Pseudomonadota bacterium]